MIFDALIGNDDRICLPRSHSNLGNILFDTESQKLRPIDQECPLLFTANRDSLQAEDHRKVFMAAAGNSDEVAKQIAVAIGLNGTTADEKIHYLSEGVKEAYGQATDRETMNAILVSTKSDAVLLDISPSALTSEF